MPTSEPSSKKIRLVTALLLLVTFATGTVTGGALVHAFSPERPGMHARMQWDALDLTGAQRDKADASLEKHRPKLDAIFNDTAPKVKEVIEQVDREIREILTPEQRSRFDRMRAERRNRCVPGFGAVTSLARVRLDSSAALQEQPGAGLVFHLACLLAPAQYRVQYLLRRRNPLGVNSVIPFANADLL